MPTSDEHIALQTLFSELTDGASNLGGAYMLNSGDIGLLRSLDKLTAADASFSVNGGGTIAAHAQHLCYGLSLMNRWATEGGNPFADAKWDEAWRVSDVDERQWFEIRRALGDEAHRWRDTLGASRMLSAVELAGMVGSIAHLAYHLGAIRQIDRQARGPREGTFG